MLSEAKDTSELMVDLAYAAIFYLSPEIAEELDRLESRLTELLFDMRILCLVAARSREDAEGMASVLQVASAIEKIGNAAVDIGRIVTRNLGIPAGLIRDLSQAEEVLTRARARRGAPITGRRLKDLKLPTEHGVRVLAIRRGDDWIFDPEGKDVVAEDDVVILQGPPDGVSQVRELYGAPPLEPPEFDPEEDLTDLGRAIDVLVEMKNISEAAVGLAYSALLFNDRSLAAEVRRLEERMDEMREQLELWTLRAAAASIDPRPLRGLLHLGVASESIGDAAMEMVWLVEENEELHPVFALSLGESHETVIKAVIEEGSPAAGSTIGQLKIEVETGVHILAIRRGGRWIYRPRGFSRLYAGDELIGVGPPEAEVALLQLVARPVGEPSVT